jgi:alpha-ketoglutarate-dependent taurine dioxygenase
MIVQKQTCDLDTIWASSYEIYDKISPAYRAFLETLTGTFGQLRYPKTAVEKNFEIYSDERGSPHNVGTLLQTTHPVVRTNPVTGWKSLLGVGNHLVRYNELTKNESDRMHDWLLQMIVENIDVQIRHRWENVNDVGK